MSVNKATGIKTKDKMLRISRELDTCKAVKVADEKIIEMRTHYAGKDDQDFIAMCLLMYAADSAIESHHNPIVQSDLTEMIRKIDAALD